MADESRVAKRYAAALFDLAEKDGATEAISKDIVLVETFFEQVPYLRKMVTEPLVSADRKRKVLSDAFGDRTTATTLNFLYLVVKKRREGALAEIFKEYRVLVDNKLGRLVAQVHSAVELDKKQLGAIQKALSARTGKNVEIESVVDPLTIGGIRVRLGDIIIDGTVQGRLEGLRQQLLGTA